MLGFLLRSYLVLSSAKLRLEGSNGVSLRLQHMGRGMSVVKCWNLFLQICLSSVYWIISICFIVHGDKLKNVLNLLACLAVTEYDLFAPSPPPRPPLKIQRISNFREASVQL
jgi:hypothetical protein